MRLLFYATLFWSLTAHAGFGGSYSRGGGGARSYSSSPSRSYSAPSRSYSAPSRSYSARGSSFGGSYSRPTPTPKQAPIVRPSAPAAPSYSSPRAEPSYPSQRHTVEHHHYGNSGGSGFFSGYLWGSLLSQPRHTTTYVQGAPVQDGGYYGNQAPAVPVERHYGFWSFVGDFLLVALIAVIIFFFVGAFLS